MIRAHENSFILSILLTMFISTILLSPTLLYAAPTIRGHNRIRYDTLVLSVDRINALIGMRIDDIKDAVICYDGEEYIVNIWLLPDAIIKTKLYGSTIEIPIIDRDVIKPGDILVIEVPVIDDSSPACACPWGLSHALARIHNRIEITAIIEDPGKSIVKYPIYIYYDDRANYSKHLEIAPISLVKKLAGWLGVDYHDMMTLKKKLLALSSSRYTIDYVRTESMKEFVFSKDYSKLLNDPMTGYSTIEALEICPTCPILDEEGRDVIGYESELYFHLTKKETGGPVTSPSSNKHNISIVYLGRGSNIEEISLYLIAGSMAENDNSTLYFKLVLQKNSTSNLFDENTWINVTVKSYYLELDAEPTYMTFRLSRDQINLEADQFYRIIIEFQWVYGSQSYLYSAVLGVKKIYDDITMQDLPGHPPATMSISQTRTIGYYFSPSKTSLLSATTVLKPISGAIHDMYHLHINIQIYPDWTRSLTSSIDFIVKIYINGVLKKTISFTLYPGEEKNISMIIPLHRSDFLCGENLSITYLLERTPTHKAYGDFIVQAYLSSVNVFPDVWNTDNPYPYVWGGLPTIRKTLNNYFESRGHNDTIFSSYVMTPITISKFCGDPSNPLIRTYYFIHDDVSIRSWKLVISSNYKISYIAVGSNIEPEEIPCISFIMNELIIGFNAFLTFVTSGLDLLPKIITQPATVTTVDLVSFFVSKLSNERINVIHDEDKWEILYLSSLGNNRKDLSVILYIAMNSNSFYDCRSAPSGSIVNINVSSGYGLYFSGEEHVKTYVFMFQYVHDVPGYPEPSNQNILGDHGIRHG